jgi:hypothetical protein
MFLIAISQVFAAFWRDYVGFVNQQNLLKIQFRIMQKWDVSTLVLSWYYHSLIIKNNKGMAFGSPSYFRVFTLSTLVNSLNFFYNFLLAPKTNDYFFCFFSGGFEVL